jgi:hypothetical protein
MASWRQPEYPNDLGELIFDLLRRPLCGSEFRRLLEFIGKPDQDSTVGSTRFFIFRRFGVHLFYELSREVFYSITFVFDSAAIRYGEERPYLAKLPLGIENTDNVHEVELKLGLSPRLTDWLQGCENGCDPKSRARAYWQHYDVPPHRVTVIFDTFNSHLDMLTVSDLEIIKEVDGCKRAVGEESPEPHERPMETRTKQRRRSTHRKPPPRP